MSQAESLQSGPLQDEAAEQLLVRTLLRVCVAAGGLSPGLDPYLDSLRKLLRKGYEPALEPHLKQLSDDFLELGDIQRTPTLVIRLLTRLGREEQAVAKAAALWDKLALDPPKARDSDLDRLAELLGLAREEDDDGEISGPNGVLSKLFGRTLGTRQTNKTLAALLQRLVWPDVLQAQIGVYIERLGSSGKEDAWVQVVEEFGRLVVVTLEQAHIEVEQTGRFLAELTERLEDLDLHMRGDAERLAAARERGERLGDSVRAEVGGIAEQVRTSSDLGELRRSLLSSLDRIQSHVDQHLTEESTRRREAETQNVKIRADMTALEREAYDLRRALAETSERALGDALTGLPNRAAYDERIAQEFARWRRFGDEPLTLLLWDIDNFKRINDQYGHKAGDKALKLIADVLRKRLRKSDFIARYGGEEFAVLMIGADSQGAMAVAEQMRAAVERTPLHSHKTPVPVTVSGGLSPFTQGDSPEQVFERADQALYRAKHEGKNRCLLVAE